MVLSQFEYQQLWKLTIYLDLSCPYRGYLAPEYETLGQLSDKVDVYSFGILLLEIISGRKNIDFTLSIDKIYLLEWVSAKSIFCLCAHLL
jgi:serine/threonine protein kinase